MRKYGPSNIVHQRLPGEGLCSVFHFALQADLSFHNHQLLRCLLGFSSALGVDVVKLLSMSSPIPLCFNGFLSCAYASYSDLIN